MHDGASSALRKYFAVTVYDKLWFYLVYWVLMPFHDLYEYFVWQSNLFVYLSVGDWSTCSLGFLFIRLYKIVFSRCIYVSLLHICFNGYIGLLCSFVVYVRFRNYTWNYFIYSEWSYFIRDLITWFIASLIRSTNEGIAVSLLS